MRVFVAGASGVIGMRLLPLLHAAGCEVFGSTRFAAKTPLLRAAGAQPLVVDVFEAAALARALSELRPEIVIHQLTDLPDALEPSLMAGALGRNARIRSEGTRNLVDAALGCGARRLIAQSIAWVYAVGREPHVEDDPLDLAGSAAQPITVQGVVALERLTLASPPLEGVVLRYGQLYGPGTGRDRPSGTAPLHVDAAAHAALLALERARPTVYNIAEDNAYVSSEKARRELGFRPEFRLYA